MQPPRPKGTPPPAFSQRHGGGAAESSPPRSPAVLQRQRGATGLFTVLLHIVATGPSWWSVGDGAEATACWPVALPPFSRRVVAAARQNESPPCFHAALRRLLQQWRFPLPLRAASPGASWWRGGALPGEMTRQTFPAGCCAALPPAALRRGCCAVDTLVLRRVCPGFWGSSCDGPPSPRTFVDAPTGATHGHGRGGSRTARDGNSEAWRLCPRLSCDAAIGASSVVGRSFGRCCDAAVCGS